MSDRDADGDTGSPVRFSRWLAAAIAVVYGVSKLAGAQFAVLESELDKPMGTVSGFWLTWYYMGYSEVYGTLLALAQIGGGLLLTFRRTALLGALLLLPIAVNIVLVDLFYGVDLGGLVMAVVLLVALLAVVAPYRERLVRAALLPGRGGGRWPRWAGRALLVAGAFALAYWTGHVVTRAPTPVDGVWVPPRAGETSPDTALEAVFFERNRAHMAVFKDEAGHYRRRHFEVDADGRIRVWEEWMEKGRLLFRGEHVPDSSLVRLWPAGQGRQAAFTLRRRQQRPSGRRGTGRDAAGRRPPGDAAGGPSRP